jgi:hypothetical protein
MKKNAALSSRVQDSFVYLCITDKSFLAIAYPSIKSSHLTGEVRQDLLQICYDYFTQFDDAPQQHFHDELIRFLTDKDDEKKKHYLDYVSKIQEMEPPSTAYIISCVNTFVQTREFEQALVKAAKLTERGDLIQARELMSTTLRVGIAKEEVGINYFDVPVPTYSLPGRSTEYLMPLGFPTLDQVYFRGLCRTDFMVVYGGYKAGKSWEMVYLGYQALLRGLNVVHITHEMSAEDTEIRYDMQVGGMTSYPEVSIQGVHVQQYDDTGKSEGANLVYPRNIEDTDYSMAVRRQLLRYGGKLIIKKYPMGSCTMSEINRYLDYLENFEGIIPDVVLNDYIEKMKVDGGKQKRFDIINDMYITSKGIADKRKLLMVTGSQVNKGAQSKKVLYKGDGAEDSRKDGNVDLAIAIAEDKDNVMNCSIVAGRFGGNGGRCKYYQNLNIGQVCLQTWPFPDDHERNPHV